MNMLVKRSLKNNRGFTLIELIVVIAVIGILATITVLGFTRYQADARDARRASSATAIAEALEKYYDANGEYPSCNDIKNNLGTVLKDVDASTFVVPGTSGTNSSLKCSSDGNTLTINGVDFFEYEGDGSADCNGSSSCVQFTLKYKGESDGVIKTISSRRQTQIATQGKIVLASNSVNFTSVNLTWTPVQNATSYTLQQSTDDGFNDDLVERSSANPGTSISDLDSGGTYYYRVKAAGASSQSTDWSNTLTVTLLGLAKPTITSVAATNTSLTPTWAVIQNAASYRLEYSTNSNLSNPTVVDTASTSYTTPANLTQGRLYYFRVSALNGSNVGSASNIKSANTTIATPAAPNLAAATNTDNGTSYTTKWAWSAGSTCPANTTMQYQFQYSMNSSGGGWTSTMVGPSASLLFTHTSQEGYTYTFRVQARCRSDSTTTIVSNWTAVSSRSYTQPVTSPTNIGWHASRGDASTIYMYVDAKCRTGASVYGNFDQYSRDTQWTTGPNVGNTGWRTPGGYSYYNMTSPAAGVVITTGPIQNGWYFTARATIVCRNSVTGVQSSPYIDIQSSGWEWGSNV